MFGGYDEYGTVNGSYNRGSEVLSRSCQRCCKKRCCWLAIQPSTRNRLLGLLLWVALTACLLVLRVGFWRLRRGQAIPSVGYYHPQNSSHDALMSTSEVAHDTIAGSRMQVMWLAQK